MLTRRQLVVTGAVLTRVGLLGAAAAAADALPAPQDQVILTVTGAIGATNAPERAEFDRQMLELLGVRVVRTWTPWTEGVNEFAGVLARDLMRAVGATGSEALATALNDFQAAIPVSDFHSYDVLLATRMNGTTLTVRDKGPLWVIYPWSDHPELDDLVTRRKSVWQLRHLHIQ
jgi:hypothetical protein